MTKQRCLEFPVLRSTPAIMISALIYCRHSHFAGLFVFSSVVVVARSSSVYSLLVALHTDCPIGGRGDLRSSSPMANGHSAQLGRLVLTFAVSGVSIADGMTIWPPDPTMTDITVTPLHEVCFVVLPSA